MGTLAAIVGFRLLLPVARSLRHRLRVERVVAEGPGVVSIEVGGVGLERLRAHAGQFFTWRFLTRERWWEAHPFSLSAAPDGRRLRITVKSVGDHTARLGALVPGTRVIAEGPFGAFTTAARRRHGVAMIAGGVGITPIRALLEEMPGDVTVVYRALRPEDVILRAELDELARERGAELHYVVGDHRERRAALAGPPAPARPRHRRARRVRVRAARDDRGDAGDAGALGRAPPPDRHRALRALTLSASERPATWRANPRVASTRSPATAPNVGESGSYPVLADVRAAPDAPAPGTIVIAS